MAVRGERLQELGSREPGAGERPMEEGRALAEGDALQAFTAQGEETRNLSLLWGSHGTVSETERSPVPSSSRLTHCCHLGAACRIYNGSFAKAAW